MSVPCLPIDPVAVVYVHYSDAQRPYGHALVAGIERVPKKVVKAMSKKRVEKRSNLKPFLKVVNYNHIMPTR